MAKIAPEAAIRTDLEKPVKKMLGQAFLPRSANLRATTV